MRHLVSGKVSRRAMVGGIGAVLAEAALLAVPAHSVAADPQGPGGSPARPAPCMVGMSATSPATHSGDRYELVLTNGATPQQVRMRVVIMDHRNQNDIVVVDDTIRVAPEERRVIQAVNNYGTVNHLNTRLIAESRDLELQVTVRDAQGVKAAFNERAFMVIEPGARPGRPGGGGHGGHEMPGTGMQP